MKKVKQLPAVYLDIDGVLLANEDNLAEGAAEFIKYAVENFDCYWLTTHCMHGDAEHAVDYVNRASKEDLSHWLKKIKATSWEHAKTDAINLKKPFLWYDDDCLWNEKMALFNAGVPDSWVKVDLRAKRDQMVWEQITLRSMLENTEPQPDNLYELIESSGLTLLVGETGSGKSYLMNSYLNYMANKYKPDEWGLVAIDPVQVNYIPEEQNDYIIKISRDFKDNRGLESLKEIAFKAVDRTMKKPDKPYKKITVHITECDLAVENIDSFMDYMYKIGTSFVMESGIQVIYETSRISVETIPRELLQESQVRLMQKVPSEAAAVYFTGRKVKIPKKRGETLTMNKYYHKYLVKTYPPIKKMVKGPFSL